MRINVAEDSDGGRRLVMCLLGTDGTVLGTSDKGLLDDKVPAASIVDEDNMDDDEEGEEDKEGYLNSNSVENKMDVTADANIDVEASMVARSGEMMMSANELFGKSPSLMSSTSSQRKRERQEGEGTESSKKKGKRLPLRKAACPSSK